MDTYGLFLYISEKIEVIHFFSYCTCGVSLFLYLISLIDDEENYFTKYKRILAKILFVSILLAIFLPNQETIAHVMGIETKSQFKD